jgi:hypothetical protein
MGHAVDEVAIGVVWVEQEVVAGLKESEILMPQVR